VNDTLRDMDDAQRKGIGSSNQDFARYEQVRKVQQYRLAEAADQELFDDEFRIRTCDISRFLRGDASERRAFGQELGSALREIGFAILEGHGVPPGLYAEVGDSVSALFESNPIETKSRFLAQRHGSINQGYFPSKGTSKIHPDLVEGWVFCRRAFAMPGGADPRDLAQFWPDASDERPFRELCLAHEALILPIMQSIVGYLGCDPHIFDRRLTQTNFGLRLNYYPPIDEEDDKSGAGRLLGHEDTNLFTLLPAPAVEGLQVLNRRNMKWIRLDAPPGTIILNTGDYMQRITNDELPSTTHRVSKPRAPELSRASRVSFPMNVYLWEKEMLEVLPCFSNPKYAPIEAIRFHTSTTRKYYGDDYAVTST
jgi:isopenicillin N synthase-like dioxygenase